MHDEHLPVVEVRQPGADPVRIKTKAVDAQHAWGKLTLRKNAKKGTFTIRVLGTDAGGRAEERTFALVTQLAGRAGRGPRGGRPTARRRPGR